MRKKTLTFGVLNQSHPFGENKYEKYKNALKLTEHFVEFVITMGIRLF